MCVRSRVSLENLYRLDIPFTQVPLGFTHRRSPAGRFGRVARRDPIIRRRNIGERRFIFIRRFSSRRRNG